MEALILGIGTDLCDVDRIAAAMQSHGQHFLNRLFTAPEQELALMASDPNRFYAGRFAAKEACVKALGTGITETVGWLDFEVLHEPSGRPTLKLQGGALAQLNCLLKERTRYSTHLSLSHESNFVQAFVVLEAT
jgi:holo-[acyl-carrier protein] synthase